MSAQPPDSTEKTALLGGKQQDQPPVYTPSPQAGPPPYSDAQKPPLGGAGATATAVVITQPVVTHPLVFRDYPVFIVDSQGRQIQTVLEYRSGAKTRNACLLLFLMGFIFHPAWCFCWVPYYTDSTKDVYHINPLDGTVVGVYTRNSC